MTKTKIPNSAALCFYVAEHVHPHTTSSSAVSSSMENGALVCCFGTVMVIVISDHATCGLCEVPMQMQWLHLEKQENL